MNKLLKDVLIATPLYILTAIIFTHINIEAYKCIVAWMGGTIYMALAIYTDKYFGGTMLNIFKKKTYTETTKWILYIKFKTGHVESYESDQPESYNDICDWFCDRKAKTFSYVFNGGWLFLVKDNLDYIEVKKVIKKKIK